MSPETINVKKRNGRGLEPLDIQNSQYGTLCLRKLSRCFRKSGEMTSGLQFYDGMSTDEIQQILIKSASDLISLDAPNYQYVARLLLFSP